MRVLSLFDGMACGMIAMQNAGVDVEAYHAYEIDKYAIKTAQHNFPQIIEHGDVFSADFTVYRGLVDFLVGGSPCTYWSIAQTNNRETTASGMGWDLFSQYVRALHEAQPKFFIYENNKSMAKAIRDQIRETFGFEEICINSALVSAQNRQRFYWVGKRNDDGTYSKVDVQQPEDLGILLKDVLDGAYPAGETRNGKSFAFTANCANSNGGAYLAHTLRKSVKSMAAEPVNMTNNGKAYALTAHQGGRTTANFVNGGGHFPQSAVAEPVGVADGEKSYGLTAHYMNAVPDDALAHRKRTQIAEPVPTNLPAAQVLNVNPSGRGMNGAVCRVDTKSRNLTTNKGEGGKIIVPVSPERIGCYPSPDGSLKNSQAMRIYSPDAKGVTVCSGSGGMGGKTGLYAVPVCVAERGRYNESGDIAQHYEAQGSGKTNALTTVQKDNQVAMPCRVGGFWKQAQGERIYSIDAGGCIAGPSNHAIYAMPIHRYATPCEWDGNGIPTKAISGADGKTYTVYPVQSGQITIKGKTYPIKLVDGYYIIRKLTVSECKRLQTVPEWYDFSCVSNSQAYKMLGNGWTCDVITHLIKACLRGCLDD